MARSHMSETEVCTVDEMQKAGRSAAEFRQVLRHGRRAGGRPAPSLSAAYRTTRGQAYKRGAPECRGRPAKLPAKLVDAAHEVWLALVQEARSQHMVTWGDIYKGTQQLLKARGEVTKKVRMPSVDWFVQAVGAKTQVRARRGRRRAAHENDYEARRYQLAQKCLRFQGLGGCRQHSFVGGQRMQTTHSLFLQLVHES